VGSVTVALPLPPDDPTVPYCVRGFIGPVGPVGPVGRTVVAGNQ